MVSGGSRPAVAPGHGSLPAGVWWTAAAVVAGLLLVAGRYGFHRDELYFVVTGQHGGIAAPDNPMLVPYLSAGWYAVVGGNLWAFRILPALAMGGYVVTGALVAREFSGRRRHQLAAAVATAMVALVWPIGHLFSTSTFDLLFTALAIWLLIRALTTGPQRWGPWLGFGTALGLALETKVLAALVVSCCLVGVLVLGPRRPLRTLRPWVAACLALAIAAPNLVWQALHGFPMLQVAGGIAAGQSTSSTSRLLLLPMTLLQVGPIMSVVLVFGLVWLLRKPQRGRRGWLAVALILFLVVLLATGGKAYYPGGFYPAMMAAAATGGLDWLTRYRRRRILASVLAVLSLASTWVVTLPLFPVGSPMFQVGMATNPDSGETVGWDAHVATITGVVAGLSPQDRAHSAILTRNYGEASALLLAAQRDDGHGSLPGVHSGHLGLWYWGPPPPTATTVIVVGRFSDSELARLFVRCEQVASLSSPAGVDNEEHGAPVRRCDELRAGWPQLWPQLRR